MGSERALAGETVPCSAERQLVTIRTTIVIRLHEFLPTGPQNFRTQLAYTRYTKAGRSKRPECQGSSYGPRTDDRTAPRCCDAK